MHKGILLDIDNTLYSYKVIHDNAINVLFNAIKHQFLIEIVEIENAYIQAKITTKQHNKNTASSHNRLLYIQNLCEILKINPFKHSLDFYNLYWNTFLQGLTLSLGSEQFFARYGNLPICLVTDLTAHIQHRKCKKLELNRWANYIVTSEEAGCEKPDPFIFKLALSKLKLEPNEVCMIGDSYEKDVLGARALGIDTYWLTDQPQPNITKGITCITNLGDIQW
jgi:FMN phosphatase YigB (HAD superfamily)